MSNSEIKLEMGPVKVTVNGQVLEGALKPIADCYGFVGDWIEDTRRFKRLGRFERFAERAAVVFNKTQKLVENTGIEIQYPSDLFLEIATPAITVTDDETLQDIWAALFAKAMDKNNDTPTEGLARILKEIPVEAVPTLYQLALSTRYGTDRLMSIPVVELENLLNDIEGSTKYGIPHLIRLHIMSEYIDTIAAKNMTAEYIIIGSEPNGFNLYNDEEKALLRFTPIGLQLIELIRSTNIESKE